MSQDESEATTGRLATVRGEAEDAFLADVRELESRARRLVDAMKAAEQLATDVPVPVPGIDPAESAPDLELPASTPRQPDQAPWPDASGGRGVVNRFAAWLFRDYLAVLDARHEALAERSLDLQRDSVAALEVLANALSIQRKQSEQLSRGLTALIESLGEQRAIERARAETLREGLTRAAEAVDMMSGVALKLRELLNAKDAEVAHGVLSGPDRKVEAVLDRLARRQEALLAELVGATREGGDA